MVVLPPPLCVLFLNYAHLPASYALLHRQQRRLYKNYYCGGCVARANIIVISFNRLKTKDWECNYTTRRTFALYAQAHTHAFVLTYIAKYPHMRSRCSYQKFHRVTTAKCFIYTVCVRLSCAACCCFTHTRRIVCMLLIYN